MALADRLDDGFRITIAFAAFPSIEFYEKDVGLPGFMGGGPIRTTTMRNTLFETKSPRSLIDIPETTTKVSFTSAAFMSTNVRAMINTPTLITYTLPDGHTYAIYGYVDEFNVDPFVIGEQPSANIKIVHTNTHPTTKAEVAPVFT